MNAETLPISTCAWASVAQHIPDGFELSGDGLYQTTKNDDQRLISDPVWISGYTRSVEGTDAGVVISWIDTHTQRLRAIPTPKRWLFETGNGLIQLLVDRGLHLIPGSEKTLLRYLGSFHLPPEFMSIACNRVGWANDAEGNVVFVLPKQTLKVGETCSAPVVFQSEERSPAVEAIRTAGSLHSWRQNVAQPCMDHPLLAFGIFAGLAGPLVPLVPLDSGGFHIYGASSKGKTTLLQAAATVWGNGAESPVLEDGYIARWNSTANAFEATAAAYNNLLLPLDELGSCDAKNVGKVIYDLFSGRGKARLTKDSSLRAHRTWQLLALSTGEISLRDKIQEDLGRKAYAGQLARLIDVRIPDEGVVDALSVRPRQTVEALKRACGHHYGTAGPAFIQALLEEAAPGDADGPERFAALKRYVGEVLEEIDPQLALGGFLETHQQRVLRRVALVVLAGVLAARFGIVSLKEANAIGVGRYVRDLWLADEGNIPEGVRGIDAVRQYIIENENRFRDTASASHSTHQVMGFKKISDGKELYLITTTQFAEICRRCSCDRTATLNALKQAGLLYIQEAGRLTSKHTVKGLGRPSMYAVRADIVEA